MKPGPCCKGSIVLGTACLNCTKCAEDALNLVKLGVLVLQPALEQRLGDVPEKDPIK